MVASRRLYSEGEEGELGNFPVVMAEELLGRVQQVKRQVTRYAMACHEVATLEATSSAEEDYYSMF